MSYGAGMVNQHDIQLFVFDKKGHWLRRAIKSSGASTIATVPYSASKFAVRGMTDALWVELRQQGIGVTAVARRAGPRLPRSRRWR